MKNKCMKITLIIVGAFCLLTGCSQSKTNQSDNDKITEELKELESIQVISREEGSGTRSTFARLAGFQADGGDASDLTTSDALIVNDAGEVINNVQDNKSAIGYVSKAAFIDSDKVKSLKVEGHSPDENEKYPLNRNFYLAYSGTLNELEQDFLTYVHGAGQEIVGKEYDTVAKSSYFLSNQAKGEIKIEGSTSVAPLMMKLAEEYEKINTNAKISVTATDSSKGLTRAMAGECDFGMSSRDLKDYEKELLDYESIARDKIVVIVDKNNPIDNISLDELKQIYTGSIKNWYELNQ